MTNDDVEQRPAPAHARMSAADVDDELLALAGEVLRRSEYVVGRVRDQEIPALIAENADNVLAVTATVTVDAAILAEPILSRLLVQQMGGHDLDGKRWDGYVALLTAQNARTAITGPLFGIAYNLRHVRRLVKVGVEPTLAAVERALRPVLSLPTPPSADELADPLALLRARLIQQGIDREAVESSFARFQAVRMPYVIEEEDDSRTLDDEDTV